MNKYLAKWIVNVNQFIQYYIILYVQYKNYDSIVGSIVLDPDITMTISHT